MNIFKRSPEFGSYSNHVQLAAEPMEPRVFRELPGDVDLGIDINILEVEYGMTG